MSDSIRLVTREEKGAGAAQAWKEQYFDQQTGLWRSTAYGPSHKTYRRIQRCKGNPDAIEKAIGNNSWTTSYCDNCGEASPVVVEMFELSPENTANYCKECIRKAAVLLGLIAA